MDHSSLRLTIIALFTGLIGPSLAPCDSPDQNESNPADIAFVGATLLPISEPSIPSGTLIVRQGKIIAVGAVDQVPIPEGAKVIDVRGKVIMPGLVCTHSHIGGIGAADGSGPIQPGVRVLDSINVRDSGFRRALAGGLTTLNVMPGSGHLIGGQTIYLKLRFAQGTPSTIEALTIPDSQGRPAGGLKMANGTNPQDAPPFPGTRGRAAFLVREQFVKAREYQAKLDAAQAPDQLPPRDLHLESLVEAMRGERIVHHHTHRHDDAVTVLRLSREFGFSVVLHHVSDGASIANVLAQAKVPCSIILVDSPGGKLEAKNLSFETAGILEQAGVRVALHTDDGITDSRVFLRMAALAVRGGMSRERALESVTLAGAEMLGLQDRVGSLSPGKDADLVVLDGDPLSVYTKVLQTWVEGELAFDRTRAEDHLIAVGGFGATREQSPYFCCFGKQWQVVQ